MHVINRLTNIAEAAVVSSENERELTENRRDMGRKRTREIKNSENERELTENRRDMGRKRTREIKNGCKKRSAGIDSSGEMTVRKHGISQLNL